MVHGYMGTCGGRGIYGVYKHNGVRKGKESGQSNGEYRRSSGDGYMI